MSNQTCLHLSALRRCILVVNVAVLLVAAASVGAQQRPTLRGIEVVGLQRLSSDQVVTASGLRIGELIDAASIDTAADRLMRTGWFKSVDYRLRSVDNDTTVIFEVTEKAMAISVGAFEIPGLVTWTGNAALSVDELSNAFGLRAGEPAPKAKFDEALDRVRKAYARRGYVNARIDVTRTLDGRRTNYRFTISEGQQFRMGVLTLTGLNAAETRSLRGRWTMAAGAVYDDSYLDQFRNTVIRPFIANRAQRTGVRSKFEINTTPDTQKQTVDVIITFK